MSIETHFVNLALNMGGFMAFSAVSWLVVRVIFKINMPKHFWKAWGALCIILIWWGATSTNGVRFKLEDEAGIAPRVGGEIKSNAPETMTDLERLRMNRRLNEENATPKPMLEGAE